MANNDMQNDKTGTRQNPDKNDVNRKAGDQPAKKQSDTDRRY